MKEYITSIVKTPKDRFYALDIKKYPLTKRSGVDRYVYSYRADNHKLLTLKDKQVFDVKPAFKFTSRDTRRILEYTKNKKGRR